MHFFYRPSKNIICLWKVTWNACSVRADLGGCLPTCDATRFPEKTLHHIQAGAEERWSISFRKIHDTPFNPSIWPYLSCVHKGVKVLSSPIFPENIPPPSPKTPTVSNESEQDTSLFQTPDAPQTSERIDPFTAILELIDNLCDKDCKTLIIRANKRLETLEKAAYQLKEDDVSQLVQYIPNVLNEVPQPDLEKLMEDVHNDLNKLGLDESHKSGLKTQWLVKEPKEFGFLNAASISESSGIDSLRKAISAVDPTFSKLNSCLISYYPDLNTHTRLHSDDLPYLSQSSPMCNFSIGCSRKLGFFNAKLHSSPMLKSITMEDKSLLVMRPKCQKILKHSLLKDHPDSQGTGQRVCISFREVVPITAQKPGNLVDDTLENKDKQLNTTILIGSSITTRIDPKKIVGKSSNANFINCSKSGAFIKDASESIDKLYTGLLKDTSNKVVDPTTLNIKNIIFSIGTNDIRRKAQGVSSLFIPLRELFRKTKVLFPGVKVYFQSLIPMGYEYSWTPSYVITFNQLAKRCTREMNCEYIDIFDYFLTGVRGNKHPNKSLFNDLLHPSPRGSGIIARAIIGISRNCL
ncbi:hypothetical protein ACHWQZ_G009533 [Mnemiopsis leidyi]